VVTGVAACDVHYYAKHLVHDLGYFIGGLSSGPWVRGTVGSPHRELHGFVGGERNLVPSAPGDAEARRVALLLFAAGSAVLIVVSLAASILLGLRGVGVGVVLAAPILAYGVIRVRSMTTFESELVCIAYSGTISPTTREAPETVPMTLSVSITAGAALSYNNQGGSKGRGFSGRFIRRVVTDKDGGSATPPQIASRLAPGHPIPKAPNDREEPDIE
jgi:hypothetical protein